MLSVTALRKGTVFTTGGVPLLVLDYKHTKVGRGTANIKVRVRNLKTGTTLEKTFLSGASVEEAEVTRKKAQYLYSDSEKCYFIDPQSFEQFSLLRHPTSLQLRGASGFGGQAIPFLKEGEEVTLVYFRGEPLSVELPLKVNLEVTETGSAEKGDTRSAATKEAVLETGYKLQVPMFVKVGDTVRVNTETGKYVERVSA